MSADWDALVAGMRRASLALGNPVSALIGDLAAAEGGAAAFEPDLALLRVDLFGGLTVPARVARAEEERRARRPPTVLERLAAEAGLRPASEPAKSPPRSSGVVEAAGTAKPGVDADPLPAWTAAVAPLFRLADPTAPTATSPAGTTPKDARSRTTAERDGSSAPVAALLASAPVVGPAAAEVTTGTVQLIAQLTESILAAAARTGVDSRREPEPGLVTGAQSAFLAETLRSLGGETAAAFGVELEPSTPEPRPDAAGGEAAPGSAAAAAPGARPSVRPPAAELVAPAQPGNGAGIVPRPGEAEADPAALAALVNDALVEQARRHGLELG